MTEEKKWGVVDKKIVNKIIITFNYLQNKFQMPI